MKNVKTKIFFLLFLSFVLSICLYSLLLAISTWNNSPQEISCTQTFSNGIWEADDPWNLVLGNYHTGDYYCYNCNCGLFGHVELEDNNPNKPHCVYYKESWMNNEKECKSAGFNYTAMHPGSEYNLCLCTFDQRENSNVSCLLDLAWRDYLLDREKGFFSNRDFGSKLIIHLISFAIILVIISAFMLILFMFVYFLNKDANHQTK